MLQTLGFRIPPAVGGIIGVAFMAIGATSGLVSLVIAGAVVVAAAAVGSLIRR